MKILPKIFTREFPLILIEIWGKAYKNFLGHKIRAFPRNIFIIRNGLVEDYRNKELQLETHKIFYDNIKKDPKFLEKFSKEYKDKFKVLEKMWNNKHLDRKQLLGFSNKMTGFWPAIFASMYIPGAEDFQFSDKDRKLMLKLRSEIDVAADKATKIITESLRHLYPKAGNLVKYITLSDLRNRIDTSELEERAGSEIIMVDDEFVSEEKFDKLKEKYDFDLEGMENIYTKEMVRDFTLAITEIWCNGESTDPRQWTEKQQPEVPFILFERKNGLVSSYYGSKGLEWIKDEEKRIMKKDKNFIKKAVDMFYKKQEDIRAICEEKRTLNHKELVDFMKKLNDWWPWFEAIWWAMEMSPKNSKEFRLLEKARKDMDIIAVNGDVVILKSLKKIFPELGSLVSALLVEEISSRKIPGRKELEKRMNHYIYTQKTLYTDKSLEDIEKMFNIKIKRIKVRDVKELKGQIACKGIVKGKVRIIMTRDKVNTLQEGEVLVTSMTTPDFLAAMKKASAFVTDEGGVTCHAAIVAREFGKPCIIGTKVATQLLKDGDIVEVDANKGIVRKLK